jgi:hypothetical protein
MFSPYDTQDETDDCSGSKTQSGNGNGHHEALEEEGQGKHQLLYIERPHNRAEFLVLNSMATWSVEARITGFENLANMLFRLKSTIPRALAI